MPRSPPRLAVAPAGTEADKFLLRVFQVRPSTARRLSAQEEREGKATFGAGSDYVYGGRHPEPGGNPRDSVPPAPCLARKTKTWWGR